MFGDLPPPTHKQADPFAIMQLAQKLDGLAEGPFVSFDKLEQLATDAGHPRTFAYAALGMYPMIQLEKTQDTTFYVCTGRCQLWGGLALLEKLLDERDARLADGRPSFDVVANGCLDLCEKPAALKFSSKDGQGALPNTTPESLDQAIAQLVDGAD